jgi:signal transduction histidine kinase
MDAGGAYPTAEDLARGLVYAHDLLTQDVPLEDRLRGLCEATANLLECDRCSILFLDGEVYRGAHIFGAPSDDEANFRKLAIPRSKQYIQELEKSRSFIVLNDAQERDDTRALAKLLGASSIALGLMVEPNGAPIGLMSSEFNERVGTFNELQSVVVLGAAQLAQNTILNERSSDHRAELSRAVVEVEDNERRRIARDIHDYALQEAFAVGLRLDALQARVDDTEIRQEIGRIATSCRAAAESLRALANDVHPARTTSAGFAEILDRMLTDSAEKEDWRFTFEDTTEVDVSPEGRLVLSRIADQAINNVRLHANATNVDIHISTHQDGTRMVVQDNGIGFDPLQAKSGHLGLIMMRERAELAGGTFDVSSDLTEGACVEAWIPNSPLSVADRE